MKKHISPLLKSTGYDSIPDSEFRSDLIEYLSSYSLAPVQKVAESLEKYDFSQIKAKMVGSVPGRHKNDQKYKFGHFKIRSLLRKHAKKCKKSDRIMAQVSSIGSLGAQETSWLKEGFENFFPYSLIFLVTKNCVFQISNSSKSYSRVNF